MSPRVRVGAEMCNRFSGPLQGFKEKVYYLDVRAIEKDHTFAAVVNRHFNNGKGIGVYVKYRKSQLDWFVEWKMMVEGPILSASRLPTVTSKAEIRWGHKALSTPSARGT
jgi:hypothetical protein